ncbi:MAG: peptidylprolyl isomerase [Anaerolineae bacterium]|nr:peptidylprolyl isomerase [Anaerolineae bacterium]
MSKRSQTTAIPKGNTKPVSPEGSGPEGKQPTPKLRQEYRSRAEREHEIQRWVILGTIAAVAIVVILLAITFIFDQVITPNQVVLSVDGQNVNISQFQRRVRLERYMRNQQLTQVVQTYTSFGYTEQQLVQTLQSQEPYATWIKEIQVSDQMGLAVIDTLIEEQLIRNEAKARGITVSQADIDKQINQYFGYEPPVADAEATAEATATVTPTPTITPTPYVSPTPSPVPTATSTPEFTATPSATPLATLPPTATLTSDETVKAFQDTKDSVFRTIRQQTGMSDADINSYFELQALRIALQDAIAADVTTTGPFVDARHILVATEEEAQDVINAINAGESFADLAKSVSTDTGSGASGGELGWSPATNYVKEFQEAVKTAEIDAIVGPVKTQFGYHIIQVRAREDRELTQDQIDNAKAGAFSTWLEEYKESKQGVTTTNSIWANYVPTTPQTIFG